MGSRLKLIFIPGFLAAAIVVSIVLFYNYTEELLIHVLQPAIEAYFVLRYYIDFVPQIFLWLIPLILASLIMIRRTVSPIRRDRSKEPRRASAIALDEGEVARTARQIHRAHNSRFARVGVRRTLVEIGTRLIAGREGASLPQARQQLADGYWRKAGTVNHFLIPRRHYTARQTGHDFERALREAVEHLEEFDRTIGSFEETRSDASC